MLTRAGLGLLSAGLTLALGGLILGNPPLVIVSALPLLVLVAGITRRLPDPVVERVVSPETCRAGDAVTVELDVTVPAGVVAVEVHQPLPADFRLEEGRNVHFLTAHPARSRRVRYRLRVTAPRRGTFTLPPVEWEVVNLLGLAGPVTGTACGETTLRVAPRLGGLARAREARLTDGAGPGASANRVGLSGTDFADLREYASGDPPKSINWKATARRVNAGTSNVPLVNEYEREGKRTVLVLVDVNRHMDAGTQHTTGVDHAVDAAAGLARFLLHQGHRVGAVLVDKHGTRVEPPDTGPAHAPRLARFLDHVAPGEPGGLPDAADHAIPFLRAQAPLVVAFTRVTDPVAPVVDAVRRLRHALGAASSATRVPVIVVDVNPLRLAPVTLPRADEARALLEALDAPARDAVRRTGARVVEWDPTKGSFANAFLKEVKP